MKKILLVDDDSVFASIAAKASEEYGYKIECVPSFKKLKARKLDDYDGFLIDYDLRDGTGDQVLEYLSERKITRPVAMISASNHNHQEGHIPAPESNPPYTFVSKWLDTDSFFRELNKAI